MPRPFKQNKLPKTSMSISEDLWQLLKKRKKRTQTMDEYLRHLIADYDEIEKEFEFADDAYNKASQKNEEYLRTIKDLKLQLGSRTRAFWAAYEVRFML